MDLALTRRLAFERCFWSLSVILSSFNLVVTFSRYDIGALLRTESGTQSGINPNIVEAKKRVSSLLPLLAGSFQSAVKSSEWHHHQLRHAKEYHDAGVNQRVCVYICVQHRIHRFSETCANPEISADQQSCARRPSSRGKLSALIILNQKTE